MVFQALQALQAQGAPGNDEYETSMSLEGEMRCVAALCQKN